MKLIHTKLLLGFTLIELMITVAIVSVLAAVGIPAYLAYLRRSYINEVNSSIPNIKSAEESYFTINGCYIAVAATPTSIPSGTSTAWPTTQPLGWGTNALAVRPDRVVRYQYEVYAGNDVASTGGCGDANTKSTSYPGTLDCVTGATIDGTLVPTAIFGNNWYVVVGRGNLDGDSINSTFVSAIDDSVIISCNEVE